MSIRNSSGPRQYYELQGICWFKLSGLLMALLCIVGIIAGDYSFFSTKINLGCDILLEIFINIEVRVCSSSFLHAIIIWNHHPFFKKFSNILPFFNILCLFPEKFYPCAYFIECALEVYLSFC